MMNHHFPSIASLANQRAFYLDNPTTQSLEHSAIIRSTQLYWTMEPMSIKVTNVVNFVRYQASTKEKMLMYLKRIYFRVY